MVGHVELGLELMETTCGTAGMLEVANNSATDGKDVSNIALTQDAIINSKLQCRLCAKQPLLDISKSLKHFAMFAALSLTT